MFVILFSISFIVIRFESQIFVVMGEFEGAINPTVLSLYETISDSRNF